MISELDRQVARFVDGEISIHQLYEWIVPRLPRDLGDSPICDIYYKVLMALVHIEDGVETEGEVRAQFARQLCGYDTYSASKTVWLQWRFAV